MKKMVHMILLGWLAAVGVGQAMPSKNEVWNTGKLELTSGAILEGDLNYNWKAEIVQLRLPDGTVKAYSAFTVSRFVYFDTEHNLLRRFSSLNFPIKPTLARQLFLEECSVGPLSVYRRLRHQHEPIKLMNPATYGSDELVYDDLDCFEYFIYRQNDVVALHYFERDLWPTMNAEFGPQLTHYRHIQHLEPSTTLTRLLLIAQYNALKSAQLAETRPPEIDSVINQ